jgi:hypothetical protein
MASLIRRRSPKRELARSTWSRTPCEKTDADAAAARYRSTLRTTGSAAPQIATGRRSDHRDVAADLVYACGIPVDTRKSAAGRLCE